MTAVVFAIKPSAIGAENGEVRIGRAFYAPDEAARIMASWRDAGADPALLCALRLAILNADIWWRPPYRGFGS